MKKRIEINRYGQITIPKTFREVLGVKAKSKLDIILDDKRNQVILTPVKYKYDGLIQVVNNVLNAARIHLVSNIELEQELWDSLNKTYSVQQMTDGAYLISGPQHGPHDVTLTLRLYQEQSEYMLFILLGNTKIRLL